MRNLPIVHASAAQLEPTLDASVERTSPRSVRISVTDRCDMACVYCRPGRGERYVAADDRLRVEAWERLVGGLVRAGVTRVRITGGEPLLFAGVVDLVERLSALGVDDLALTTNASRLSALAVPLRRAGLRRLNVSIDSLDAERFRAITRGGDLDEVLHGIHAARDAGFDEIKTNTVVLRDRNDDEVPAITQWAWARGITPRFLEMMFVGEGARLGRGALVPYDEMRASIASWLADEDAVGERDRGPAKYVRAKDGAHRVGFITGSSHTFCEGCDRLRVTSDGVLRPCLSQNTGVRVTDEALRAGDAGVHEALRDAWAMKPDGSWKGCTEASAADVSMRGTGG